MQASSIATVLNHTTVSALPPNRTPNNADLEQWIQHYRNKIGYLGQRALDRSGKGEKWQNYREIYEYCARYRLGMAKKGLLLVGPTGTGKTTILEIISDMFRLYWRTASEVSGAFSEGQDYFEDRLNLGVYDDPRRHHEDDKEGDIVIDELGFEPESVMVYGTRDVPLAKAIDLRYQEWRRHQVKTFFSTNLPAHDVDGVKGLVSRYSERIWSRLNEMCEIVTIACPDRRMQSQSRR